MWSTLVVVSCCLVAVLYLLFVPFFSVEFHGFFFGGAFSFFPCCPFCFLFCSVRGWVEWARARERMGKKDKEARRRTKRKDEEKGRREMKRYEGRRKMDKEKEKEKEEDQN